MPPVLRPRTPKKGDAPHVKTPGSRPVRREVPERRARGDGHGGPEVVFRPELQWLALRLLHRGGEGVGGARIPQVSAAIHLRTIFCNRQEGVRALASRRGIRAAPAALPFFNRFPAPPLTRLARADRVPSPPRARSNRNSKVYGTSGGALTGCLLFLDIDVDALAEYAYICAAEARASIRGAFKLRDYCRGAITQFCTANAHEILQGRFEVSITRIFPWYKNLRVNNFPTYDFLIQSLHVLGLHHSSGGIYVAQGTRLVLRRPRCERFPDPQGPRAQRNVLQASLQEDQPERSGGRVPVLQQPGQHPAQQVRAHLVGVLPSPPPRTSSRAVRTGTKGRARVVR